MVASHAVDAYRSAQAAEMSRDSYWPTRSEPEAKPLNLCLVFHFSARPDADVFTELHANEEFDIGRKDFHEAFNVEDRCVSTHHLRIRCISYEDEENQVDPMVYMTVLSSSAVILTRFGIDEVHRGIEVDKGRGDVLLSDGDQVQVTNQMFITFCKHKSFKSNPPRLDIVRRQEALRFADRFCLTSRVLGIGGYAAVYVAVRTSDQRQLACKIVELATRRHGSRRRHRSNSDPINLRREATATEYNVLKALSHPNIISLEKVLRTSHNAYIFQELITGGDLLSFLDTKDRLTEAQAAVISRQLLEAVDYLHRNQVVHRDIKPENILMTSWRDGARVVLTDFGQSRTIVDLENAAKTAGIGRMQSIVGTYGYTAPEVFRQMTQDLQDGSGYSKAIDMWSIGSVAAMLLTNQPIFPDGRDLVSGLTTLSQFSTHLTVIDGDSQIWASVSRRAKAFLRACLTIKEEDRITASDGLKHPWFTHPLYHAEFDAAYQRAIEDWQPRHPDADLIEILDTSDIPAEHNVRSRHFAAEDELHASPVVPDTPPHNPYPPWRTSTIPRR